MTAADLTNPSERCYAEMLDSKGVPWERPRARVFRFANTSYTPDFYLPIQNTYVEVIGTRQRWFQLRGKVEVFKQHYPQVVLQVVDKLGNCYGSYQSRIHENDNPSPTSDAELADFLASLPPPKRLWQVAKKRRLMRLTQEEASLRAWIDMKTWLGVEHMRDSNPPMTVKVSIADVLGLQVSDVWYWKVSP